jgi:hypothetical protein
MQAFLLGIYGPLQVVLEPVDIFFYQCLRQGTRSTMIQLMDAPESTAVEPILHGLYLFHRSSLENLQTKQVKLTHKPQVV